MHHPVTFGAPSTTTVAQSHPATSPSHSPEMRLTLAALLSALPTCLSLTTTTTSLTLQIPPSPILPNPNVLPPSTHATLTTLYTTYSAPITVANAFVFHNVTPGSYLADVHCASYGFAPLRVDVSSVEDGAGVADGDVAGVRVQAWETFRGNDWANKGEEVKVGSAGAGGLAVRCLGKKLFFQERGKFSVLTILKNPMILIGLVSMGIFFGMPKLMENMDPEMRAEFEESQKNNPMSSLMAGSQPTNPMSNFDMAGFLAGSSKNEGGSTEGSSGNGGNGGKKGGKR
ncbi:hypothetical protein BJ170DRAFT_605516 [Xylariales sp. AK1849]|nr:hypothetical protein BJ170DRAFT_605516 [Xylariales sp. AK1849]